MRARRFLAWPSAVLLLFLTMAGCGKNSDSPNPAAQEKLQEKIKAEGYPTKGPRTPGSRPKQNPPAASSEDDTKN